MTGQNALSRLFIAAGSVAVNFRSPAYRKSAASEVSDLVLPAPPAMRVSTYAIATALRSSVRALGAATAVPAQQHVAIAISALVAATRAEQVSNATLDADAGEVRRWWTD